GQLGPDRVRADQRRLLPGRSRRGRPVPERVLPDLKAGRGRRQRPRRGHEGGWTSVTEHDQMIDLAAIDAERDRIRTVHLHSEDEAIEYLLESHASIDFTGPDGERLELIADPVGEMYGTAVL